MPKQRNASNSEREYRTILALQTYHMFQFRSLRRAVSSFNVPHRRLSDRDNTITFRPKKEPKCMKLTHTEKRATVQYILDLES